MGVNKAEIYKKFGIDPGPVDKSKITLEEVKEELIKLTDVEDHHGFLYFLLEYTIVMHPTRGGVKLSDDIYTWQMEAAIDFLTNRYFISKKVRQVGFSTIVGAYALWRALFFKSQAVVIVSLSQRESTTFLKKRVKYPYENLPDWLRQETAELAKTTITFENNNSTITALPNTEDPGRSDSLSLLIVDEFAAMKNQSDLLAGAVPTLSSGAHTPFTNSSLPSQMFIISTLPRKNVIDNDYLRILHEAQEGVESKYKIIDVSVDDIPCHMDSEWHKEQLDTLGERNYKIEILGLEAYDMEDALIPTHILEKIIPQDPIRVDFLHPDDVDAQGYYKDHTKMLEMVDNFDPQFNYIKGLWIWEDSIEDKEYVIICDVATGRATDWSTACVFDPDGNVQVAEYRGKIDTENFKKLVMMLCEYYNYAKLSIENTGLGAPVVEWFATTKLYERLYWHKKSKRHYTPGFPMSAANRANAIAIMQSGIVRGDYIIKSVRLINELRTFGYSKSGKIEGLGKNDDLVMTLVQYCFLQNIGWAVTDKMIRDSLPIGVEESDDSSPVIEKVKKYWEKNFDMSIDDETANMMAIAEATGYSVSAHDVDRMLEEKDPWDYGPGTF